MVRFHFSFIPVTAFTLLTTPSLGADFQSDLKALNVGAVFPGDAEYAGAIKPFNLRFNFHPAAVTFPNTPANVSHIVTVGAKYGKKVVPRGGGHSYIGNSLGGENGTLVVDMSHFKSVVVHSDNTTATIGTGNRVGDIALKLFQHGRAMPHGACPYIGIGGHANFGGFGFTSRMWGLTLDVIESIDLVLANGTIATVSSTRHPDLFWAMRGAGSSYAITTALTVRTFPAPSSGIINRRTWILTPSQAATALTSFQTLAHNKTKPSLPPYLGGEFVINPGPSPGLVSVLLYTGFWGPPKEYNVTLSPWINAMPFAPNTSAEWDGNYIDSLAARWGRRPLNTSLGPDNTDTFYVKSLVVPEVSKSSNDGGKQVGIAESAWKALFEHLVNRESTAPVVWFIEIELWGGQNSAITAVPLASTSFAYRNMMWVLQIYTYSLNQHLPPYPDAGFAFADGIADVIVKSMPQGWEYGAYTNYVDSRLQDWQKRYYASHYPALQALKSKYDPRRIFNFPTAIQPLGESLGAGS